MKTQNPLSKITVAVLTAAVPSSVPAGTPIAACSFELSDAHDGWYQLLPAGHFSAPDGRPQDVPGGQWFLDEQTARDLIELTATFKSGRVIDYEHQTLNAEKNGQPAPAAGRMYASDMQWREDGLWIKPRLTPRAKQYIDDKEYLFLSAVFPYDAATGKPLFIHSAALTNDPGLDGLQPFASLKAGGLHHQETTMDPILKAMLEMLGITVEDGAEPDQAVCTAALTALINRAATSDTLATEVAALKAAAPAATTTTPDPTRYVPIEVVTDLQTRLATLSAETQTGELSTLIATAKADGRLLPSMESWANELGKKDIAALKAYLDKAAPIAALKSTQTHNTPPPPPADNELTAEDMAVLKASGLSKEEFLKSKQELSV